LSGAFCAIATLAAMVLVLGPALERVSLAALQLVIGAARLLFGMGWLRKAVLRAGGILALRKGPHQRGATPCQGLEGRHYCHVVRRSQTLALIISAAALAGLTAVQAHTRDMVIYNHSPSMPVGFYLRAAGVVTQSSIVTVRAADVAPMEARARNFDGPRDRFIKHVAALGGDVVCASAGEVSINGRQVAVRSARNSEGRPLASWQGCRRLRTDELFLLGDTADSFDSRYWGLVRRSQIEGVWRPL
jgi:conjugative transfer signal peptidase TraF